MAAPTVTVSLDKPTYAPGEKMILTVNYADADTKTITLTVVAPVADDPHHRRLIVLVADPECGYVLHRIQLPAHVDNGEELATFAEHALTELKADPEWTARIARLGELEARPDSNELET